MLPQSPAQQKSLPKLAVSRSGSVPEDRKPRAFVSVGNVVMSWAGAELTWGILQRGAPPITVTQLPSFGAGLQLGSDGVEHGIKQHLGRLWLSFRAGGVALAALIV